MFFERALIYVPLKLRAALFPVYTVLIAFDGFITFESFITFVTSTEYKVYFASSCFNTAAYNSDPIIDNIRYTYDKKTQ